MDTGAHICCNQTGLRGYLKVQVNKTTVVWSKNP